MFLGFHDAVCSCTWIFTAEYKCIFMYFEEQYIFFYFSSTLRHCFVLVYHINDIYLLSSLWFQPLRIHFWGIVLLRAATKWQQQHNTSLTSEPRLWLEWLPKARTCYPSVIQRHAGCRKTFWFNGHTAVVLTCQTPAITSGHLLCVM